MKKNALTLVLCALLAAASGVAQVKNLPFLSSESINKNAGLLKSGVVGSYPRHTLEYIWNADWILDRTLETKYDSHGNPVEIQYTTATETTHDLFTYNAHDQETEKITQILKGGTWENQSRQLSTYNASGYPLELRTEQWYASSWELVSGRQMAYEMNGENIHVITTKEWTPETESWNNLSRETYAYSGTGNDIENVIYEKWESQWMLSSKTEYSWSQNRISQLVFYDYLSNAWVRTAKYVFEFPNANTNVMTVYADDGNGGWIASSRSTSQTDAHGNLTLNQLEMNLGAWTVYYGTRFQLTYDGNNVTQRVTQTFAMDQGADWKNSRKEVFSNFASLGTDLTVLPKNVFTAFPNPAGDQTIVHLSAPDAGSVTLSVVTMTGQKILEKTFAIAGPDQNYQLNLGKLQPGSYLLIARDVQGSEIGRTRLIRIGH